MAGEGHPGWTVSADPSLMDNNTQDAQDHDGWRKEIGRQANPHGPGKMTSVTRIYSVDYVSFEDDECFAVGSHMSVDSTFFLWCVC